MEESLDRSDVCFLELAKLVESAGYQLAFDFLYYRDRKARGRAQLVPIENESQMERIISLHSNEKKIHLYVFREMVNVELESQASQPDGDSRSTRNKRPRTIIGYPFNPKSPHSTTP